jgi:glutamate--cysteine ligase catalytic subunit
LSSAAPIWGGYLSDIDCRYDALSQAGDDRTPEERQRPTLLPRCSTTPLYLSDEHNHLNDIKLDMNENVVSTLISHGQIFFSGR